MCFHTARSPAPPPEEQCEGSGKLGDLFILWFSWGARLVKPGSDLGSAD